VRFQNGFESGELDKWCLGKVDDPAYQRGLAWLENFNLIRSGGINRRKGYRYADRILEIREPEYRRLDRDGGPEEYRAADSETPAGEAETRRADTLFGTASSTVKLIPLSYGGNRNFLVYLTVQNYGYIEFDGYSMVRRTEHPWPPSPYVNAANIFRYNRANPEAYWKITQIANVSSTKELKKGLTLDIGGNTVTEAGKFIITDSKGEGLGKLVSAKTFSITPAGERLKTTVSVTQNRTDNNAAVSFFDEKGAGKDLRATCTASVKDDAASLSFQVLDGGSGFAPDTGKDTTTLDLSIENVGTVIVGATVSSAGSIMGIQDYKVRNYPSSGTGNAVMRWNAPPILPGLYSEISDWNGAFPTTPATLEISVEQVSDNAEKELGPHYRITAAVKSAGLGFAYFDNSGTLNGRALYTTFLKVAHMSDAGGQVCRRELRVAAEVYGDGSIARVHEIPYWIDDDLAAYEPADGDPGDADGCFSKIMSAAWFNLPYGVGEEGTDVPGSGTAANPADEKIAPFKYIVKTDGSKVCRWKGCANDNYTAAERQKMGGGPVKVLQEFAGIWYEKTLLYQGSGYKGGDHAEKNSATGNVVKVLDFWTGDTSCGNWHPEHISSYWAATYPTKHLCYPLAYRAEKTGEDSTRVSWYEFDPFMAGGCPKPVAGQGFSSQPSLQWFAGAQRYSVPYTNALELVRKDGAEMWFLPPVPEKRNNTVPNYVMFGAAQETASGTYQVTRAGAYKGSGAKISVASGYVNPTDEYPYGRLKLTLSVTEAGKDYLARNVDGIILSYMPKEGGYVYELPVYAARGSGGMLVIRNQDKTPLTGGAVSAVYYAEAVPEIAPPATGSTVNLSTADGVETGAKCVTVPKMSGTSVTGWNVSLSVPTLPSGEPCSPSGFAEGGLLDASWNTNGKVYTIKKATSVEETVTAKSYLYRLEEGGRFKTDPAGKTYYGSYGGASYDLLIKESLFVSESVLNSHANPDAGLYKVQTDEELGGGPSYWVWNGIEKKFEPAVVQTYPETDAVIDGLQYAYTGAYLILCGSGITPFKLGIDGNDIVLGGIPPEWAEVCDLTAADWVEEADDGEGGEADKMAASDRIQRKGSHHAAEKSGNPRVPPKSPRSAAPPTV
jgi:hypothetical protein